MNAAIVYQEEQRFYPWLIALIFVACALSIVIPMMCGVPLGDFGLWIGAIAFGIVFLAFWLFRKLIVQITPSQLIFGFPVWKVRLPLSNLEVTGVVMIPKIAGAGMHYWAGKAYYNAKMGHGVEVKSGGKTYVIGSDTPDMLSDMIKSVVI